MPFKYTENESLQYADSDSSLVDFYKNAPLFRHDTLQNKSGVVKEFIKAYNESPELAMKLLFWLRDPRSGQGEKASGRKLFVYLYNLDSTHQSMVDSLEKIVKHGSYKDINFLYNNTTIQEPLVSFFSEKIKSADNLACKWAPRLHSKDNDFAMKLRDKLGFSNKEYRKYLKDNSDTVEQKMAKRNWDEIIYSKVPSVAMKRYGKSFDKHDATRFDEFKNDDSQKVNANVLYPHEVVNHIVKDKKLAEKFWKNLPNYLNDNEIIFPIIDVSSSMIGNGVMDIAISLGLYLAERMSGQFKNSFMTFDSKPRMIKIEDKKSLSEKMDFIRKSPWGGNTNFEASYRLLLDAAKLYNITQDEMPTMIICLSDMQFNKSIHSAGLHLDSMKSAFKNAGYKFPKLVFWDLRLKQEINRGSHAKHNDKDVALVAGFSPTILKAILSGDKIPIFTPYQVMLQSIDYIEYENTTLPLTINYIQKVDESIYFDNTK